MYLYITCTTYIVHVHVHTHVHAGGHSSGGRALSEAPLVLFIIHVNVHTRVHVQYTCKRTCTCISPCYKNTMYMYLHVFCMCTHMYMYCTCMYTTHMYSAIGYCNLLSNKLLLFSPLFSLSLSSHLCYPSSVFFQSPSLPLSLHPSPISPPPPPPPGQRKWSVYERDPASCGPLHHILNHTMPPVHRYTHTLHI